MEHSTGIMTRAVRIDVLLRVHNQVGAAKQFRACFGDDHEPHLKMSLANNKRNQSLLLESDALKEIAIV